MVTVAVATYNSSQFIKDTLESIKFQSFQDIYLIVSDDGSQDDTLEITENWLKILGNRERFSDIEIIQVEKNTGVSANCNRIIKAAKSDWIKFIAGDDILLPNCIEDNLNFVKENPEAQIIFSQVKLFKEHFNNECFIRDIPLNYPNNLMHPQFTVKDQYEILLLSDRINYTPSFFFNKEALLKVGGYDENNKLIEDYPMWLKLTKAGIKLYYFHKPTVGYRMHPSAQNNKLDKGIFKPSLINSHRIKQKMVYPNLPWEFRLNGNITYIVSLLFEKFGLNRNKYILTYRIITSYLNPFFYVFQLKKRFSKNRLSRFYNENEVNKELQ